jgi:hypothetical protein
MWIIVLDWNSLRGRNFDFSHERLFDEPFDSLLVSVIVAWRFTMNFTHLSFFFAVNLWRINILFRFRSNFFLFSVGFSCDWRQLFSLSLLPTILYQQHYHGIQQTIFLLITEIKRDSSSTRLCNNTVFDVVYYIKHLNYCCTDFFDWLCHQ